MCVCSLKRMTRPKIAPLRSACSNRFRMERLHPLLAECLLTNRRRKGARLQTSPRKRPNHHLVEVIATARSVSGSLHPPLLKTSLRRETRSQNLLNRCLVEELTHSQASSSHQASQQSRRKKKNQLLKLKRRIAEESLSSKLLPIHLQRGLHLRRRHQLQPLAWEQVYLTATTNQAA